MSKKMNFPQSKRLPHGLCLAHITLKRLHRGIIRPVGGAAIELIKSDNTEALVHEAGMRVKEVVAWQTGPTVHQ